MTMNGAVLPVLALYRRGGRGTGRAAGEALGHHPERHSERVHGAQHLHLSAGALDADHLRHLRLHARRRCRSTTRSRSPAITCRRPARRRISSSPIRSPTASNMCAPASPAGLDVDRFAPRLSFFWAIGMNFFMEVAKMRAARLLWAKLLTQFNPKDPRSLSLRTHCQTSGWSLTAQDVFNNVMRTTIEAMAATQGHTQSLHTNALDEALALPTDFSARIARNTQLFLQQESGTNRIIDPWGGSYYVERLTRDLAAKAWGHIQEVEALGGMAKAIEAGVPKLRIEEASAKTQARIDAGEQAVIGVNKYKPVNEARDRRAEGGKFHRAAAADRQAVAAADRARPEGSRRRAGGADPQRRRRQRQSAGARDRCRARQSHRRRDFDAMEKVFGRHRAEIKSITGVYKREASAMSNRVEKVQALIDAFEDAEGRRPRILVAKIGQDGHDRGQKVIASAFADVGFDVDIGPLFATADEAARQAVENDVHILGVSSLAAAHLTAGAGTRRPR